MCRTRVRRVRRKLKDGTVKQYQILRKIHKRHCDCPIVKSDQQLMAIRAVKSTACPECNQRKGQPCMENHKPVKPHSKRYSLIGIKE